MAITRERFEQGLTYEGFKAAMTRNQERFEANEQGASFDADDLSTFTNLPETLNVVVIAEDWCGDVVDNLPLLGRIAQESNKLNLRIFLRDQNLDLIDQYLNEGKHRSIPVFVFFDQQFNELGIFIERPVSVTERNANLRAELSAEHPEFGDPATPIAQMPEEVRVPLMEALSSKRAAFKAVNNQEVVSALRAIVSPVQS